VQYWKGFVEAEFFNIAQRIRKEVESREETTEEAEDTSAQEQEEQQIRTFSASLLPLLRSDLPADIQDTFLKTIEEAVIPDSNYIASYSVQVYKLI
jgi:DNA phosphorothioation-dependent restriction protein DptG